MVSLHDDPRQDPYAEAGLQTLCRSCHVEKTSCENRKPLTPEEQAWMDFVKETVAD